MARRGEAAARFARGLAGSVDGGLMTAWLQKAAAAPGPEEFDAAVRQLRQATESYLRQFPGQGGALEMTLGRSRRC